MVFHVVGPLWNDGTEKEPQIIEEAIQGCLVLADKKGLHAPLKELRRAVTLSHPHHTFA